MKAPKGWFLQPHVSACCLARMASRTLKDRTIEYICTSCDRIYPAVKGHLMGSACACSMQVGKRNAGIRCKVNTNPKPEFPATVYAEES